MLGFLEEAAKAASEEASIAATTRARYLDATVERRRRDGNLRGLVVDPIRIPSLKHCSVPTAIDAHSADIGHLSREYTRAFFRHQRAAIAAGTEPHDGFAVQDHQPLGWRRTLVPDPTRQPRFLERLPPQGLPASASLPLAVPANGHQGGTKALRVTSDPVTLRGGPLLPCVKDAPTSASSAAAAASISPSRVRWADESQQNPANPHGPTSASAFSFSPRDPAPSTPEVLPGSTFARPRGHSTSSPKRSPAAAQPISSPTLAPPPARPPFLVPGAPTDPKAPSTSSPLIPSPLASPARATTQRRTLAPSRSAPSLARAQREPSATHTRPRLPRLPIGPTSAAPASPLRSTMSSMSAPKPSTAHAHPGGASRSGGSSAGGNASKGPRRRRAPGTSVSDAGAKMCVDCMLEFQYGADPIKGPRHRHYTMQVRKFGHLVKVQAEEEARQSVLNMALTTKPTFGARIPISADTIYQV